MCVFIGIVAKNCEKFPIENEWEEVGHVKTPFADLLFPVDRIRDRLLKAERRFRDRSDPLALPEDILYERYRFSSEDILVFVMKDTGCSSEGIRYLIVLVGPYVGNATKRSRAQCVCVSLRFVATGTYLHTVGDAENISKKVPCATQCCSCCPKYTAKYVRGVSQLFANTNCQVANYQLAENDCLTSGTAHKQTTTIRVYTSGNFDQLYRPSSTPTQDSSLLNESQEQRLVAKGSPKGIF
ncbi:hypothetical protein N1851_003737 [Merluccius polli]|uniref:Uncharacterized protein n=1 Tax=Merluccius polli TaxID=89951 RepID=A0AA47PA90_MERPO|nr:hypothetical protein N1851_003737 [Merluccius polli]